MTKQYYNPITGELQTVPPWGADWVSPKVIQELYGDWQAVDADFNVPVSLDIKRETLRDKINAERDRREAATPFLYQGKLFDYDNKSRERLNKAIQAAQTAKLSGMPTDTVIAVWTLYDNTTKDMTVQEFLDFPITEAQRSAIAHNRASELKDQLEAATEIKMAEIEAALEAWKVEA